MRCPVCEVELKMTDRQGVEIDYCPQCRGVWLDRGELDKIIERNAGMQTAREERPPQYRDRPDDDDRPRERYDDDQYKHRKRRGFLGELFDFD
jgi:Zn-finger nucleic acid-binding protein